MWYALPKPDGRFASLGGHPKLKKIPHGAVEITEEQYRTLKRNKNALWHRRGEVNAINPETVLSETKQKIAREINALRDLKIQEGIVYIFPDGLTGTVHLHSMRDVVHVIGLGAAATATNVRGGNATFTFHDAEEIAHNLNAKQMTDVALAIQTYYSDCYETARTHNAAIALLITEEIVESYDFTLDWPAKNVNQ